MLKTSLLVIVAVLAVLAYVVAIQPPEYQVARSGTISAPASVVFDQINDFHHWAAWSPWGKLDSGIEMSYAGPAAGVGAVYSWWAPAMLAKERGRSRRAGRRSLWGFA